MPGLERLRSVSYCGILYNIHKKALIVKKMSTIA
jgi:hypothetical protein